MLNIYMMWRVFAVIFTALMALGPSATRSSSSVHDLLAATARGAEVLRAFLRRQAVPMSLLNSKDEHGFSALAVAAYGGDAECVEILINAGARVEPGEISVSMGASKAQIGSLVELVVRRGAMLIMLGTHFELPEYLKKVQKSLVTSRPPSLGDSAVPDITRTLELLVHRAGAMPTEKSLEEGSDLSRAAYFLDAGTVEILAQMHTIEVDASADFEEGHRTPLISYGASRALVALVLGIGQLKHRLNRALMSQPRMAGRLFRDYYGFTVPTEAVLLDSNTHGFSFADTFRMVQDKAVRITRSLLVEGLADPSFRQSRQSQKTALHHCAEHGLEAIGELLIEARADLEARTNPLKRTPLHQAIIHRSTGLVRAMLAARADPLQEDSSGKTALDIARLLRWPTGQMILGSLAHTIVAPRGAPDVLALPELLPPHWFARSERGEMGANWRRDATDCEIDIVESSDMTPAKFLSDFLSIRRPLLVRGGALYMSAMEKWSNLRYLKRKAGATQLTAVTIPYPDDFGDRDAKDARKVSLKDYVDTVMGRVNSTSGTPLYVFSVVEPDHENFKKLRSMVDKDAGPHPPWLAEKIDGSKLRLRFGNVQFGLGPAGSGAPQHYHTHAYASLFSGQKRWWFFPPPTSSLSRLHAVQFASEDRTVRQQIPDQVKAVPAAAVVSRETLPLVCEQLAGDIIYVPSEWGHLTLNGGEMSVSVSREFTWDGEETDSHAINSLQL